MTEQTIIWCVIAGIPAIAFLARAAERIISECRHRQQPGASLFEMAREREMLFISGDDPAKDDDADECEDI